MPSRASPQGHPGGSSRPSDIATSYYGAGLHNARASNNPQTVYESNAHVVRESNNARAMYEGSSNVRAMYDNNGRAMYENNARNMYDNNSIAVYARGNRVVYGTNQQHHNNHNNNNNNHPPGGTLRGGGPPGTIYGTHPRGNFDLGSSFECVSTYDMSNQNVLGTAAQAPYIVAPPSAYIAGNQNTLGLSSHYNANRAIANAHSTGAPLLNALPGPAPHPNNAHAGAQQSKSPYIATQGRSNTFDSTTGSDSKQDSIPRFRIPPGARLSHSYKRRRSSCPFAFHYTPQPSVHRTRSVMEDGLSVSSGSAASGAGGSSLGGDEVVLRINVPELKVEKCLQFHKDDLVWDVKQQALAALPKELRESFNYGLFCPPQNGRAGKFLDEERPLVDYPFTCPVGYLELKYKRRVYKMLRIEEKALRALHTRANLRRFVDSVKENNTDKVTKMCAKGLDPNFHCQESGETPLTIAARVKKPGRLLVALVNGGALLDYRSRDGVTAMHRAVQANNFEAVKTMLDLGASPNYRDSRGLTPLYYSVTHATDPLLCEALLHDYASIGATDNQGWHEVHQACRNKLVQHLEHLLFYGADMNAQNASGNTPLHVCAVNNLEDCTRVLLFRGCDKNALNFANQTPYQVAVIAGNMELAEVIKNHSIDDVVPFKEPPKYNPNRRISGAPLSRAQSDPRLEVCALTKPPSPSPSSRSIPPFSSASSLSETSTGSGSTCTHPSEMDSEECVSAVGSASINAAAVECCDVVSDSSGVCTSNSGSAESYDATPTDASQFDVGMLVVCLQQYTPHKPGHLDINPGDILEITGSTDTGYLEGCLKGVTGVFPPHCVQEVRLRNPQAVRESLIAPQVSRVQGRREMTLQQYGTAPRIRKLANEPRTVVLHRGKKGFGFVLRGAKATSPLMERPGDRGPALQYLDDVDPGGVADLAGLKRGDYLLKINGEDVSQASHEHVVTLIRKSGDLVQMTVMSPAASTFTASKPPIGNLGTVRRGCQTLPRKLHAARNSHAPAPPPRDPRTTLSVGRARAKSMVAGLQDIEALDASMRDPSGAEMSTSRSAYQIPGGGGGGGVGSGSTGSGGGSGVNSGGESQRSTPSGTPQQGTPVGTPPGMKVASIKARPSSKRMTAAEVEDMLSSQGGSLPSSPPATPTGRAPRVYASVAEMKKAKAQKARMVAESSKLHKDFHSTPDLQVVAGSPQHQLSIQEKRKSHSQEDLFVSAWNARNSRHSLACPPSRFSHMDQSLEVSRESSKEWQGSTGNTSEDVVDSSDGTVDYKTLRRSQSAVNPQMLRRAGLHPPPSHPPPPPPLGQLVKVDIARSKSDYATVGLAPSTPTSTPSSPGIMSSFRPTDCAKLYASPEEIKAVGYRSPDMMGTLNRKNGNGKSRSQSLPPSTSRPSVHKGVQEKDSSNDSGIYSTTYSTFRGSETDSTRSQESDNSAHSSTSTSSSSSSQNSMSSDTVTYARPKNNRSIVEPAKKVEEASTVPVEKQPQQQAPPDIPEPDYSSDEDNTYDSQDDSQVRKVRAPKKKNYSVMFSPNISSSASDMCDTPHYAAPAKSPIPTTQGSNFKELIAKKAAERQARSDSTEEKSSTPPVGSPSKNSNGENGNGSKAISDAIQQSAIFQRQKEKATNGGMKHRASIPTSQTEEPPKTRSKLKSVKSCPSDFNMEDGDNSSSGVSSDQDVQCESNNYVTVINTESDTISGQKTLERLPRHASRDDSSEASESSDEASDRTWILTNEKPEKSELVKETESAGTRRTGTLTRNAVSLVKLPPPQESGEPDIEVDLNLSAQQRMSRSVDQDTISTLSSLSSLSSGSGSAGDRDIPPSGHHHHLGGRGLPPQGPPHQGPPHQGPPHQGPPHQGPPHQGPPHQGPPHQGPPHQGPPHQGPPHQGPPHQGPPHQGPPHQGPPHQGPPHQGHPHQGPPHQGPPHQGPPHQGPPHQGPLHQGPPLQAHPLQGHPLQGHVMQRPPNATLAASTSSLAPSHPNRAMAGGTLDRNRCGSREPHEGAEYMAAMERTAVPYVMSASCPDHGHHPQGTNVDTGETEYERSIEESLQLIRQHMDSLNEVNTLAGIQAQTDSSGMVLAPPPEFSDLSGMAGRQGAQEKNRTVIHISSDTYEPTTRMVGSLTKSLSCSSSEDTRNFRTKTLSEWTTQDTTDWLESLFMPEYKNSFAQQEIDGQKLMCLNNDAFINLGVRRVGHRINMEKSLKRYMPIDRIDL